MLENPQPNSLDVVYDVAMRQLDEQLRELEQLDTKLGLIFGVASVVLGLLLNSLLPVVATRPNLFLLAIPLALYLITLVVAVWGYRVRSVQYPPNLGVLYEEALFWDPVITKRQLLSTWVEAFDINGSEIRKKATLTNVAVFLLAGEALAAIAIGVLIQLY
jgi:hypothetical protein